VAVKHRIYVISDEIYEKLVYDDFTHHSIASLGPEIKDLTLVVNGVSKSHSMTGWRIGFAAGPKDVITAMANIQSQSTSNPHPSRKRPPSRRSAGRRLSSRDEREFDKRRRYMVDRLNRMSGVSCIMPVGAFLCLPERREALRPVVAGRTIRNSSDMAAYLLEEAKVALVSGDSFGADAHIRLSYATSMENITKGLDRIENAVNGLK